MSFGRRTGINSNSLTNNTKSACLFDIFVSSLIFLSCLFSIFCRSSLLSSVLDPEPNPKDHFHFAGSRFFGSFPESDPKIAKSLMKIADF